MPEAPVAPPVDLAAVYDLGQTGVAGLLAIAVVLALLAGIAIVKAVW